MYRFVVFSALVAIAVAAPADSVANVGVQCVVSNGPQPVNFQVEGCSFAPCSLPQLEDAVFKVKFNAPRDSEALRAQISFYIFANIGMSLDLGPASEACGGLDGASCPVKEGQELEYELKLPIDPYFPVGTSMPVELRVLDDSGAAAFCARVPVQITNPRDQQ